MSVTVFPNELLLRIFAHLCWPVNCRWLLNVALANRTFNRLARTFLFSHFAVSHYVSCPQGYGHDTVYASHLLLSRCLEFWTSQEIAPLVRSCEISEPVINNHQHVAVSQLLSTFFHHIEHFMALRRLHLSDIELTGLDVSTFAHLPMLDELILEDCRVANGASMLSFSSALRLSRFEYIIKELVEEWLRLLEPSCLRVLRIDAVPNDSTKIPVFPYVHDLSGLFSLTLTRADITFLRKFPGVTKLEMDLDWTQSPRSPPATLPADVLPALTEFIGPLDALTLFLARNTLSRIRTHYETSLDGFIVELQQLPAPLTNLIHLTAFFGSLCTATTLEAIFESLPRLEDVEITFEDLRVDRLNPAPARVLSKLPSISGISCHLQRLVLIWDCMPEVKPHTIHCIESDCDFPAMRAALKAQCPELEVLWLDGRDFIFCWHTQDDNMDETEVIVTDPNDVTNARVGWEVDRQLR